MKKTANEFIQTNEEYVKLRESRGAGEERQPRETPEAQGPGGRGHAKADFSNWTTEELQRHAAELDLPDAESMGREELIERIKSANAARHRRAG